MTFVDLPDDFAAKIVKLLKEHCPNYDSSFHSFIVGWAIETSNRKGSFVSDDRIIEKINDCRYLLDLPASQRTLDNPFTVSDRLTLAENNESIWLSREGNAIYWSKAFRK